MIELILVTFLIAVPIYLLYLLSLKLTKKKKNWKLSTCLIEFTFCCYFVNLLNVTGLFELRFSNFTEIHATPNLVPIINTVKEVLEYGPYVLKQVLLNILLFIPFGFLVSLLNYKKHQVLISALLISLTIEVLQYFNGRFTDIDDIIWNVSGAVMGYIISMIIKKAATSPIAD